MSRTLPPEVLHDRIATSLAQAVASANKRARELGVDAADGALTITRRAEDGGFVWRVNYGPADYIARRGGDLVIDVDSNDGSVKRVLRGQ